MKIFKMRLYICSVELDVAASNSFIQPRWGAENSLHWILDMTIKEDAQR